MRENQGTVTDFGGGEDDGENDEEDGEGGFDDLKQSSLQRRVSKGY